MDRDSLVCMEEKDIDIVLDNSEGKVDIDEDIDHIVVEKMLHLTSLGV